MKWTRYERTDSLRQRGQDAANPGFFIRGPLGNTNIQPADLGDITSGQITLPAPGDYTINDPTCEDRYVVEIYEPVPRRRVMLSEPLLSPSLSDADNREIDEAYRLASLENSRSLHARGQEWADKQAQEADGRAQQETLQHNMEGLHSGG